MNTMRYKGYAARIEYSDEDGGFIGHIAGIRDIVGFHGESVDELRAAFKDAVEDYIETCKKADVCGILGNGIDKQRGWACTEVKRLKKIKTSDVRAPVAGLCKIFKPKN